MSSVHDWEQETIQMFNLLQLFTIGRLTRHINITSSWGQDFKQLWLHLFNKTEVASVHELKTALRKIWTETIQVSHLWLKLFTKGKLNYLHIFHQFRNQINTVHNWLCTGILMLFILNVELYLNSNPERNFCTVCALHICDNFCHGIYTFLQHNIMLVVLSN